MIGSTNIANASVLNQFRQNDLIDCLIDCETGVGVLEVAAGPVSPEFEYFTPLSVTDVQSETVGEPQLFASWRVSLGTSDTSAIASMKASVCYRIVFYRTEWCLPQFRL